MVMAFITSVEYHELSLQPMAVETEPAARYSDVLSSSLVAAAGGGGAVVSWQGNKMDVTLNVDD